MVTTLNCYSSFNTISMQCNHKNGSVDFSWSGKLCGLTLTDCLFLSDDIRSSAFHCIIIWAESRDPHWEVAYFRLLTSYLFLPYRPELFVGKHVRFGALWLQYFPLWHLIRGLTFPTKHSPLLHPISSNTHHINIRHKYAAAATTGLYSLRAPYICTPFLLRDSANSKFLFEC